MTRLQSEHVDQLMCICHPQMHSNLVLDAKVANLANADNHDAPVSMQERLRQVEEVKSNYHDSVI